MEYSSIPGTELNPASICMGSTHIGTKIDQDTAFRLFDLYVEAGGNFLDTANVYGNWVPGKTSISEKIIGRWMGLRKNRGEIVLATKGAHPELDTMHVSRLSRAEIVGDLDDSLRNLGTDVIDLYWLHRDDPGHPIGDILETLNDQVKAGKIRYFGCSNWTTARIQAAQTYAAEHGLQGFVANQPMWSLAVADPDGIQDTTMVVMDQEMEAYHRQTGLAAIAYSSQGQGTFHRLAAGTLDHMDPTARGMYQVEANRARVERIKRLGAETGLSLTQIVLGYLLSQPYPTIPIVGCRTEEQVRDSLSAAGVCLDPDQVRYLEDGEGARGRAHR